VGEVTSEEHINRICVKSRSEANQAAYFNLIDRRTIK
jgi:hypothetical protein